MNPIKSDFYIKAIQPADYHLLADMLYHAIHVPEGEEYPPREIVQEPPLKRYIETWGRDQYDQALLAIVGSDTVGTVWGRVFSESSPGFGFIDNQTPELSIALLPAFRGQGIGTQLLQAIIARYQELDISQLSLSVSKQNPALRLYQRLGFTTVEESDTSLIMKKVLNQMPASQLKEGQKKNAKSSKS